MESVQTKGDEILNEIIENHNENIEFQALYYRLLLNIWLVTFKILCYLFILMNINDLIWNKNAESKNKNDSSAY